jgi:hypothetical protein
MKRNNDRKVEDALQEGIRQIKTDLRTIPDPELYDRINGVMSNSTLRASVERDDYSILSKGIHKPVFKLGWSIIAGAAAVIAGIMVGNFFYSGNYTDEKEAYIREITMQSSDMSGLSAQLINYYNEDNP